MSVRLAVPWLSSSNGNVKLDLGPISRVPTVRMTTSIVLCESMHVLQRSINIAQLSCLGLLTVVD